MIFVFNDFLSQGDLSVDSDKQLIDIMIYALSIRGNQKFGFPFYKFIAYREMSQYTLRRT